MQEYDSKLITEEEIEKALEENNIRAYFMEVDFKDLSKEYTSGFQFAKGEVNSGFICFKLLYDSRGIILKHGCTIYANIRKITGETFKSNLSVLDYQNGIVLLSLSSQVLSITGVDRLELVVVIDEEKTISPKINYAIYDSFDGEDKLNPENHPPLLDSEDLRLLIVELRKEVEANKVSIEELVEKVQSNSSFIEVNKSKLALLEEKVSSISEELENSRSATTGERFDNLDERIDCEIDRLNKKIDITFLQQENKESYTIDNTVEGMTTDMTIKGRTLANALQKGFKSYKWLATGFTFEGDTLVINGGASGYQTLFLKDFIFKPNTKYTVIANIEEISLRNEDWRILSVGEGDGVDKQNAYPSNNPTTTGIYKESFTTPNVDITDAQIFTRPSANGKSAKIKWLMVLEGDWTNKTIPQYFEGIKSFGEKEDKISILSHGKNLFNPYNQKAYGLDFIENNGGLIINGTSTSLFDYRIFHKQFNDDIYNFINSLPVGTKISLSNGAGLKNYFDVTNNGNHTYTRDTVIIKGGDIDINAFVRVENNQSFDNVALNIQLEIGDSTSYEPYKCDKKDILLQELGFDEGLRGFNSTVCDALNNITKKAIKRVGKYTIDSSTEWTESEGMYYFKIPSIKQEIGSLNLLSNNFIVITNKSLKDIRAIRKASAENVEIKFLNSDNVTNLEEAKSKAIELRTVVYYELEEPIETLLEENINLKTFGERTYISFENAISGTSSFKAPVDSAKTIAMLTSENDDLKRYARQLEEDMDNKYLDSLKQSLDNDFRLMQLETSVTKIKMVSMSYGGKTPYQMISEIIGYGNYDKDDLTYKTECYFNNKRMTEEEFNILNNLLKEG